MEFVDFDPDDARLGEVLSTLVQLRPHLDESLLRSIYRAGYAEGLRFTAVYDDDHYDDDHCVAVAGWRIVNSTHAIRKLYVDDLVTDAAARSGGYGHALLEELEKRAAAAGCRVLDLDSGVQRFDAHRFYLRERMHIASHHFVKQLTTDESHERLDSPPSDHGQRPMLF